MKAHHWIAVIAASALLGCATDKAPPPPDPALRDARAAAERWLAQVDRGDLGASWEQVASAEKAVVQQVVWEESVHRVREPLGKPTRSFVNAVATRFLADAPPGDYVVIQYTTQFDKLPVGTTCTETLMPMRDKDGAWRVMGYYIKTPEQQPLGQR
jgi:hypothetical protein